MDQLSDKELIVDGYNGQVYVSPAPTLKKEFQALIVEEKQLDAELDELKNLPAKPKMAIVSALLVNTGLALDGNYHVKRWSGGSWFISHRIDLYDAGSFSQ